MSAVLALLAALPQAPAGAWVTEGGSLARDRRTETAPLLERPVLAWRRAPEHERVGEPRVWGRHLVIEELRDDERALVLLELATGAPVGRAVRFETELSLAPAVWEERVVVRADADTLEGFELSSRGLKSVWRWDGDGALGEPLLAGATCLVVDGGSLVAVEVGARRPTWRERGAYFGPLVCGRDDVEALGPTPSGNGWQTTRHDRGTGARIGTRWVWVDGAALGDARRAALARLGDAITVRPERPVPTEWGLSPSILVSGDSSEGSAALRYAGTHQVLPAAGFEGGWILRVRAPVDVPIERQDHWEATSDFTAPGRAIATRELHAELLAHDAPPSVARGVAYLAGLAVDVETLDVAWRGAFDGALLPVRGGVLHLAPDGALELWREPAEVAATAFAADGFPTAVPGWSATDAVARLADGSSWSGELAITGADPPVLERTVRRRRESVPLASVDVLREADGAIVWASDPAALLRGVERDAAAAAASALEPIAKRVLAGRDAALVERLVAEVARWRPDDADLAEDVEGKLARLARARAKAGPEPSDTALVAALDDLAALPARYLVAAIDALPEPLREEAGAIVVRRLLELDERDAFAWAWIVARAPIEALGTPRESAEWLRFVEATRRCPIAIRRPPDGPGAQLSPEARRLGGIAASWRPDVVAYDTERLLLLSTLERPGAVAEFAASTELYLDALESLFEGFPPVRRDGEKLEVRFFPTREEYVLVARPKPTRRGELRWGAEYEPKERVSYVHVPDGVDGYARRPDEFGAALGLHWMDDLCPAVEHHTARVGGRSRPGVFLLLGFLRLADTVELDVRNGEFRFGGRTDPLVEMLASLPAEGWLPWERLFAIKETETIESPLGPTVSAASPHRLGTAVPLETTHLLHGQAAAAVSYLVREREGPDRRTFAALFLAWYHGWPDGYDFAKALGREPADLGAEVRRWVLARRDAR